MPSSESRTRAGYYPALDGFRAVAVLLVFFHHYLGTVDKTIHPIPFLGWIGVDFFFVLSGFLITGILYDSRSIGGKLKTFYMRRVCTTVLATVSFFLYEQPFIRLKRHFTAEKQLAPIA